MRIAQITPVYPPDRGGMGRVAFEYTERLRARGHDVHVVTPAVRLGNAGVVWPVTEALTNSDVAHLHYPFYGGAEPIAGARAAGQIRALIVTYHMDATAAGWKGAAFDVHRETTQPWLLSQADRVLVSSEDYAASSSLAGLDRWQERTTILPFGVDLTRFQPGRALHLRAELGLDNRTVVLFVGRLDNAHRFKGVDVLLAAMARLAGTRGHLVIVGGGDDRAGYETMAASIGVDGRVTFIGDVPDDALPDYYRMADVHVLPSVDRTEAFGLVTLEAAASGLPTVVSDVPGARGNVAHDETGLIVRPGDPDRLAAALRCLVDVPDRATAMGRAARQRVERLADWNPLIDRLERIYREILDTPDT